MRDGRLHAALLPLHRWVGLTVALFLSVVAITGSVLAYEADIDRATHASLAYVTPRGAPLPLAQLVDSVRAAYPGHAPRAVTLPAEPRYSAEFAVPSVGRVFVDPYTGKVLGARGLREPPTLARRLHLLHVELLAGRAGRQVVGALSLATLFLALTGLVLWWPRRIVRPRVAGSWKLAAFDLHNSVGFYTSVLLLVVALSGAVIAYEGISDPLIDRLNPSPPAPPPKGTKPVPGARPIAVEQVARLASAALPGAAIYAVPIPAGGPAALDVRMKFPEDRTPAGRSHVYIDQYNGTVLRVESTRDAPIGTRIQNLKRSVHTGDVFGTPTRILYSLVCLALLLQIATGVLMWWNARRRPAARAAVARG